MKVLLAEDDGVTRHWLEHQLRHWGYQPVVASDGEEAWDAFQRENAPSCALLDWGMPKLDGLELCRRVRALPDGDRFVLLVITVRQRPEDLLAALDAGANDYLAKPIESEQLRTRLIIGNRDALQIARRKESEKALLQYAERLRRVHLELDRFVFVTAHHLQEPLRSIVLHLQLLLDRACDRLDDQAKQGVQAVISGALEMRQFLDDLWIRSSMAGPDDLAALPSGSPP